MARRIKRPFIETPSEKEAFRYGIELAASVASDYDKYSYHSHLVSECILGKLGVTKGRPHKNPWAAKIKEALDRLDRKVGNLEGTMRFMTLASKLAKKEVRYKRFAKKTQWKFGIWTLEREDDDGTFYLYNSKDGHTPNFDDAALRELAELMRGTVVKLG